MTKDEIINNEVIVSIKTSCKFIWNKQAGAEKNLNRVRIGEVHYEANTSTIGWKEAVVC